MQNVHKTLITIMATAVAMIAPAIHAATIVYNFDDNNGVVDVNDFSGDGVTADTYSISRGGFSNGDAGDRLASNSNIVHSFAITVPDGIVMDFTDLDFKVGYRHNGTFSNSFNVNWALAISTGSGIPNSGSLTGVGDGSNVYITQNESVPLSDLTDLTNTTVTFTLTDSTGIDGGLNNSNRFTFLDDVTITGIVIPEPSTAILAGLGLLGICFRRRSNK